MLYKNEFEITDLTASENLENEFSANIEWLSYEAFRDIFKPCAKHFLDFVADELIYSCVARVKTDFSDISVRMYLEEDDPEYVDVYYAQLSQDDKDLLLGAIRSFNNKLAVIAA